MGMTIISFDPETTIFALVGELEKTHDADWRYCETFEDFLSYLMAASGGSIILRENQLKAVESCIGKNQTSWQVFVLCADTEHVEKLERERPHYQCAIRSHFVSKVAAGLSPSKVLSEALAVSEAL